MLKVLYLDRSTENYLDTARLLSSKLQSGYHGEGMLTEIGIMREREMKRISDCCPQGTSVINLLPPSSSEPYTFCLISFVAPLPLLFS